MPAETHSTKSAASPFFDAWTHALIGVLTATCGVFCPDRVITAILFSIVAMCFFVVGSAVRELEHRERRELPIGTDVGLYDVDGDAR